MIQWAQDGYTIRNQETRQCLNVLGTRAGTGVTQHPCSSATHWQIREVKDAPSPTPIIAPDTVGIPGRHDLPCGLPAPETYPSGLKAQHGAVHGEQHRQPDSFLDIAEFASAGIAYTTARDADGHERRYYWAEGLIHLEPAEFSLTLQWSDIDKDTVWHSCTIKFTTTATETTRTIYKRGVRERWIRACLSYKPTTLGIPSVRCTARRRI